MKKMMQNKKNQFAIIKGIIFLLIFSNFIHPAQKKNPIDYSDFISGKRILFLGDSITQDGRYVSFIEYYLNSNFPDSNIDLISIGLSSETVSGLTEPGHPYLRPCLFERLDSAIFKIKPGIIVACYGMNDGIYHPQSEERFKKYKEGIKKLIHKADSAKAKLILITPPMFDTVSAKFKPVGDDSKEYGYSKPSHRYNQVLGDYAEWLMSLKMKNVLVIDLHSAMTDYAITRQNETPDFSFSKDGIHPQDEGHLFMAQTFLAGIGIKINRNKLSEELKKIKADSLFILIDQYRRTRSKGWLSYIGFKLEKAVKTNEILSTEEKCKLLHEHIVRYLKNLKKG